MNSQITYERGTIMVNISVIVPVYNVEKYVVKSLNSVFVQWEDDIEIIIIDDGSKDSSAQICEEIISAHLKKRIKLIHQTNQGLSAARNRGLKEATGRYIMFLDSDDELAPEALKVLRREIEEKPDVEVFYFDAYTRDEINDGRKRGKYDRKDKVPASHIMDSRDYFIEYYVDNMIVSACLCLIKRSVIDEKSIFFDEGRLYEDNLFSFKLILASKYVCYLPFKLYVRRYRPESITTRKISHKDIEDISHIIREYLKNCEEILNHRNVALFNSYMALIYKTYLIGKEKMQKEQWDMECMRILPDEIFCQLSDVPDLYKGLSYFLLMYRIGKGNEFIPNIRGEYQKLFDNIDRLAEGKKIAIYGMGKHTDIMLQMYKKYKQQSVGNWSYIDTYKENSIEKNNREIVNISNIKKLKLDLIIISSYYYRLELIQMCKKYAPDIEVFDFYKQEKINLFENYEKTI